MVNLLLSLTSGMIAAFSPCVAIMIPLLFYRFVREKKWLPLSLFSISFVFTFYIAAAFLSNLFNSSFGNGFQLGLGLLFVVLGGLELMGKAQSMKFPVIKNPVVFGSVFAVLMSANPCTFAYIGVLIGTVKEMLWLHMVTFGVGLLIPAVSFVIFGEKLFHLMNKSNKYLKHVNYFMTILLVFIGVYMIVTIKNFGMHDTWVASGMMILMFVLIVRSLWSVKGFKELAKPANLLLLLSLALIVAAAIYQCSNNQSEEQIPKFNSFGVEEQPTCSMSLGGGDCAVCKRCIGIFSIALGIGTLAIAFIGWKR